MLRITFVGGEGSFSLNVFCSLEVSEGSFCGDCLEGRVFSEISLGVSVCEERGEDCTVEEYSRDSRLFDEDIPSCGRELGMAVGERRGVDEFPTRCSDDNKDVSTKVSTKCSRNFMRGRLEGAMSKDNSEIQTT